MKYLRNSLAILLLLSSLACSTQNRTQSKQEQPNLGFEDNIDIEPPRTTEPPPPPPVIEEMAEEYIEEKAIAEEEDMIFQVVPSPVSTRPSAKMQSQQESYMPRDKKTPEPNWNTEEYASLEENVFHTALQKPLSTFSIDVDNASYSNCRRYLSQGRRPPVGAVRVEEFINYFDYDYPQPKRDAPFSINMELSDCPWASEHKLVHIGLQGKELRKEERQASNLTFLIDVSGSMRDANKLPLLKQAFRLLLNQLDEEDRVAIVVYAAASGMVLPSTAVKNKDQILAALDNLEAGGSTAGASGIQLAYQIAEENLLKRGNNRIILATDGDFNIGISSTSELVKMMEEKRQKGIFLSVLGLGMGNYKDHRMEQIADKGNGNYVYIDNLREAKKVFVNELTGTLFTIAKDVKIQIEFNPAKVKEYRLIGYENRKLQDEDFNDDTKDAGELGAGHTVTALYEIIPADSDASTATKVDELKYQSRDINTSAKTSAEWMTVKLRYKDPNGNKSKLLTASVLDQNIKWEDSSENFRFSAAVGGFAMVLRNSAYKGDLTLSKITQWAKAARSKDEYGYRAEFVDLVELTDAMKNDPTAER